MAPGKPVGVIKVQVPRHNAQRIGAKLTAEVEAQADSAGVRTDVGQSSHEMTQAIESASEWNSLLLTARANRGPQWDVGTQQFHVEEYSDLYYDPGILRESAQKQYEEENGISEEQPERRGHASINAQRDGSFHLSNPHNPPPNRHPGPMGGPPSVNYPYPNSPSVMRGPGSFTPGMPQNQYGRHDGSPARMPMHMGGGMGGNIGGMGGGMSAGMAMGMGMGMGGMGGMGNMNGGNMGGMNTMGGSMDFGHQNPSMAMSSGGMGSMPSPGMMAGRRMTRGMAEEYGMH
ncbi:hypothetical protein J3R30DRAFT_3483140 [Lentinula aciculospora]|uniref:Uncharacterized protein n=1 Tax=Lentinula aciculospora TaxID=153920 RepID=A0A9W9A8R6_9AGAR|nr:hypothetical protein J3R30DRAFT_3483140 [Lentinula aciculospora]